MTGTNNVYIYEKNKWQALLLDEAHIENVYLLTTFLSR
jgi:hypothetical protein